MVNNPKVWSKEESLPVEGFVCLSVINADVVDRLLMKLNAVNVPKAPKCL